MANSEDLLKVTNEFFEEFCDQSKFKFPTWSKERWIFNGEIEFQDKRGCYALLANEEIIYIGVGIGHSFGIYHGAGLGDRLKRYWQVEKSELNSRKYFQRKNWEEVTSIMTIGFDESNYYLAAALEVYLISKFNPRRNRIHSNKETFKL